MDCSQVGNLIFTLRKEKKLTQKELAEFLHISDKTVSKWERGLGCPDVTILTALSQILGVNVEQILAGALQPNDANGGSMKRVQFYVCPDCGGVLTATAAAEISCCGRKLEALEPRPAEEIHGLNMQEIENDLYITFDHEMEKDHYISFVAYVGWNRTLLVKLYPEQGAEVRIPKMAGGKIYHFCSQHGLWETQL